MGASDFFNKVFGGGGENLKEEKSLQDIMPLLRIEDGVIILKDGRVAKGYELDGAPFESMKAEEYQSFCAAFENAALSLPQHYIVQKIDVYHSAFYPFGRDEENYDKKGFFEKQVIKHFAHRPVLRQKSYLFVISDKLYNTSAKGNALTSSTAIGSRVNPKGLKDVEKRIDKMQHMAKAFIDTLLSTSFVRATEMNSADVRNLYYRLLNLEFKDQPSEPYKQILNNNNNFSIGEKKVNVVSMEETSSEIFYSVPNWYGVDSPFTWRFGIYLPFPHITVTSFYIDNTENVITSLKRNRTVMANTGALGGEEAKVKAEELGGFIQASLENHSRFISSTLQVILFSNDDQLRSQNVQEAADAFRATGFKPIVETFDNLNLFFSCLPGASGYNSRWLLMESAHASCMINPTTEFISKKNGDYACDRNGNLVYLDLSFNDKLINQNTIVVGPSGSGKSFTMGHFMIQRYERGERQITIDVGGTYKNIFEALGSNEKDSGVKYFEYSVDNPIKFNPFLCPKDSNGNYEISEDKTDMLCTLLGLIVKGRSQTWSQDEWSVLQKLIPAYYEDLNKKNKSGQKKMLPRLDNFYQFVKDFQESSAEDPWFKALMKENRFSFFSLENTLEPYVTGKYKDLLNSDDLLDISDYKMVCFDMAGVKDNERIYPIVAVLIIEMVLDTIRKFPNERKYFTMDEAWSMLSDTMGDFVSYMYRTIRKCNGGVTIITQGVDELNTPVGNVIKKLAETKIILNHTNDSAIDSVVQAFGFTMNDRIKIKSIRVASNQREFFVWQGGVSSVMVLEPAPSEHAILTSRPVERNHLNTLKKFYKNNVQHAVQQWVEDKESGLLDKKD